MNSKLKASNFVAFVLTIIGTPYVYGAKLVNGILTAAFLSGLIRSYPKMYTKTYSAKAKKFVGKVCTDCSGLVDGFIHKGWGSSQLYANATKRGLIADISKAPVGAVLWRDGHVGVYIGNGYCVEAKGIDYGTVKSKVADCKFTHWLLFEDIMDYTPTTAVTTKRKENPYKVPKIAVSFGMHGEEVKWVQFELNEHGIKVPITGNFDKTTGNGVRKFQQSCKITVDGVVGPDTRSEFNKK